MAMPRKQSKESSELDKEISKLFRENCEGIQIPMMDIPKVYAVAKQARADGHDMKTAIIQFVNTIRKN